MGMLTTVLTHPVLVSCIAGMLVAQILKFIIGSMQEKKTDEKLLFSLGGMPSSHSAFVSSLAASVFLYEGPTTAFFVSCVVAAVVIRDALGVRKVVEDLLHLSTPRKEWVHVGHTPAQVIIGCAVGVGTALVIGVFYGLV